jgi:hypothetical protein
MRSAPRGTKTTAGSEELRSRVERKLMQMLEDIEQRHARPQYGDVSGDYHRGHKLAPSRHADFAWPGKHKAIDVWDGVHSRQFFVSREQVRDANQMPI